MTATLHARIIRKDARPIDTMEAAILNEAMMLALMHAVAGQPYLIVGSVEPDTEETETEEDDDR